MMNCHQATRLLSESQDRKLRMTEQVELKFHLLVCSGCRNFSQQMGSLRYLMREFASQSGESDKPRGKAEKPDSNKPDNNKSDNNKRS
ncbi:zf-HC2 domain-containing protein [Oceanobacter mangrovi]|uniref:zf-HC2 domain-containing protein n=1 Tax=Oceanobacter mangrovi TaxID=2862510 RepID=UPI001C8E7835|nr:zf-HC2 domain-containing protein [Oceanobacter mangrovi]